MVIFKFVLILVVFAAIKEHEKDNTITGVLETHEIGITDEPKEDELGVRSTLYTVAFVTVNFEQPIFVNGSISLLNASDSDLMGTATLLCGHTVLPSAPLTPEELSPGARLYLLGPNTVHSIDRPLPVQLMAQSMARPSQARDRTLTGVFVLHKVVTRADRQQWMEYVHGDGLACKLILAKGEDECEDRFCSVLTGPGGLTLAEEPIALRLKAPSAIALRPSVPAQTQSQDDVDLLEMRGRVTLRNMDMADMYSFLQATHTIAHAHSSDMGHRQYFELIEDPLLNLVVPMFLDVVVPIIMEPLLKMLCSGVQLDLADMLYPELDSGGDGAPSPASPPKNPPSAPPSSPADGGGNDANAPPSGAGGPSGPSGPGGPNGPNGPNSPNGPNAPNGPGGSNDTAIPIPIPIPIPQWPSDPDNPDAAGGPNGPSPDGSNGGPARGAGPGSPEENEENQQSEPNSASGLPALPVPGPSASGDEEPNAGADNKDSGADKDGAGSNGSDQDGAGDGSESGNNAGGLDIDGDLDINGNGKEKDKGADGRGELDASAGASASLGAGILNSNKKFNDELAKQIRKRMHQLALDKNGSAVQGIAKDFMDVLGGPSKSLAPAVLCQTKALLVGLPYRGVLNVSEHRGIPAGCIRLDRETSFVHYINFCGNNLPPNGEPEYCGTKKCAPRCRVLFANFTEDKADSQLTDEFDAWYPLLQSSALLKKIRRILNGTDPGRVAIDEHNTPRRQGPVNKTKSHASGPDSMRFKRGGPGSCIVQTTPQACIRAGPALHTVEKERRCAWCIRSSHTALVGSGADARCVSCQDIINGGSDLGGYQCTLTKEMCEDPNSKKAKQQKKWDGKTEKQDSARKANAKKSVFKPSEQFKTHYPVPEDELHWSGRPFELEMHAETAEAIVSLVADSLHRSVFATLRHSVNQSVVIGAGRALTQSLSSVLTNTLTFSLAQMLSRTLPMAISKEAVAVLIPAATETIVPSITASLTHQPESDYYCWYCEKNKIFCSACETARNRQHRRTYRATYHAQYYSKFYAHYYAGNTVDAEDELQQPDRRPQGEEVGGAKGREKSGTERASADREKAYKEKPKMEKPAVLWGSPEKKWNAMLRGGPDQ